jgi:RNA methyltransferase, TrmH family
VEGPQAVREALGLPGRVQELFVTDAADPDLVDRARERGVEVHRVDESVMRSMTETVHPQGVLAVCELLDVPLEDLLARQPRLVAVCVDVRDPGNAGTVVRCADAAGADGVVLAGSSVDPYNGKAVRASAGSLFHLPVVVATDPSYAVKSMRSAGLTLLATTGAGELDLDDALDDGTLADRSAWLFGNEAHGLPAELLDLADHRVRIPIRGRAESLNLATAAAVCLYASARAHR